MLITNGQFVGPKTAHSLDTDPYIEYVRFFFVYIQPNLWSDTPKKTQNPLSRNGSFPSNEVALGRLGRGDGGISGSTAFLARHFTSSVRWIVAGIVGDRRAGAPGAGVHERRSQGAPGGRR